MDLSSGLVAYYPFYGNSFDESGNGFDGTVSGAIFTDDRFGYINTAYNFDGTDDYIHLLSDEDADSLDTYFSVSVWFKSESISGDTEGRIITRDRSDYWCIYANQSTAYPQDLKFSFDSGADFTFTNIITDNNWHMATATWNLQSNEVKFYFDSVYKNSLNFNGFISSSRPVIIGDNTEDVPNPAITPFDGKIDDIRLYNRVLAEVEIQTLYHQADWPFLVDFTATPRFGNTSLEVNFTDVSNSATDWEWDFQNDGSVDSYEQNPVFTYSAIGMYDVKLKATFGAIIDSLIQTNYIVVQESHLLAPQNPLITISGSDALLNWDYVLNADYYLIYATNASFNYFDFIDYTTSVTTYTHTGIISEKDKYFYYILGFDGTMRELTRFIEQNPRKSFDVEVK
ncbi:MAG: PKD domain-containing protein [Candidatus Cloacimonetes bacterium]|nr:PKD domain-containing protein [Candidatus Cloacimonadota bacterium]